MQAGHRAEAGHGARAPVVHAHEAEARAEGVLLLLRDLRGRRHDRGRRELLAVRRAECARRRPVEAGRGRVRRPARVHLADQPGGTGRHGQLALGRLHHLGELLVRHEVQVVVEDGAKLREVPVQHLQLRLCGVRPVALLQVRHDAQHRVVAVEEPLQHGLDVALELLGLHRREAAARAAVAPAAPPSKAAGRKGGKAPRPGARFRGKEEGALPGPPPSPRIKFELSSCAAVLQRSEAEIVVHQSSSF